MDSITTFKSFKKNIEEQPEDKQFSVYYDCPSEKFINRSRPINKSKLLDLLEKFDPRTVILGTDIQGGQGSKRTITFYNSKSKYDPQLRYIQVTYNP